MVRAALAFRRSARQMPTQSFAARRRARVGGVPGALLLLLCAFAVSVPASARCLPVADRQDRPAPTRFAAVPALYPGLQAKRSGHGEPQSSPRLWAVNDKPGPALPSGTVELTFLGHSSFIIRTHTNVTAITDYNGYVRAGFAPDIVTMNRAHDSHYTDVIEPGVKHVLRGWMEKGVIPRHDVRLRDMRVTNVPTNIRETVMGDTGTAGNSIFIFESAGLCVVHLGHLHHRLKPGHASRVGTVDVLLAPIDDSFTMPQAMVAKVIDDLKPTVVIPMHYGYGGTLERFITLMRVQKFAVRIAQGRSVKFSKLTMPARQTVIVLGGGHY